VDDIGDSAKARLRKDGYLLTFKALTKGNHTFIAKVDGRELARFDIVAVSAFNPDTAALSGLGLCNGAAGEKCSILIRCRDYAGELMADVAISTVVTVQGMQTAVQSVYHADRSIYEAEYHRPLDQGQYELAITINDHSMPGSPFKLLAHDHVDVDINRTTITLHNDRPTEEVHMVVIETYDLLGSRWRLSSAAFIGAKLECSPSSGSGGTLIFDKLTDHEDGKYTVEVKLQRQITYSVRLKLPDGRSTPGNPVTIPEQTQATAVFASGSGLETGNEGILAVIDVFCQDKDEKPVMVEDAKISASIWTGTTADRNDIRTQVEAGRIYYMRPRARSSAEDADKSETTEFNVSVMYGGIEASISPFSVLSAPWFYNVAPVSFSFQSFAEPNPTNIYYLFLIDEYSRRRTAQTTDLVVSNKEGAPLKLNFTPIGLYRIEMEKPIEEVLGEVSVAGNKLKPLGYPLQI
jgi:hypothetical protein